MLYVVEIRREREHLAEAMSGIRQWLDAQRFDPQALRCITAEETLTFRLEFRSEMEAVACAGAFGGQVRSIGDTFLAPQRATPRSKASARVSSSNPTSTTTAPPALVISNLRGT